MNELVLCELLMQMKQTEQASDNLRVDAVAQVVCCNEQAGHSNLCSPEASEESGFPTFSDGAGI
jgi:hypothetical protein